MSPPGDDVTLGEVFRAVQQLDRKVDTLQFVHPDVYEAEKAAIVAQLAATERYIQSEVATVRGDLRQLRSNLRAAVLSGIGALATLIAGGAFATFHR